MYLNAWLMRAALSGGCFANLLTRCPDVAQIRGLSGLPTSRLGTTVAIVWQRDQAISGHCQGCDEWASIHYRVWSSGGDGCYQAPSSSWASRHRAGHLPERFPHSGRCFHRVPWSFGIHLLSSAAAHETVMVNLR
jgi:hypothetical protein